MTNPALYPELQEYCASAASEFAQISKDRLAELDEISEYIREQRDDGKEIRLTVICTHNSRRSHMGQLWLAAAAAYYNVDNVSTASGGTEATAFNTRAVAALRKAGFRIEKIEPGSNPVYSARFTSDTPSLLMFSKRFDDDANPSSDFAAIMVCSEADAACPIVPGAAARFAIPYKDPKYADNSSEEAQAYEATCRQIAREMLYVMRQALDS